MLRLARSARIWDQVVETPAETGDGELAQAGENEREVWVIERREEREGSGADPTERR
jgi:hypothetical protein